MVLSALNFAQFSAHECHHRLGLDGENCSAFKFHQVFELFYLAWSEVVDAQVFVGHELLEVI